MTIVATEEPPPPPPARKPPEPPNLDPIQAEVWITLVEYKRLSLELWEGFVITLTVLHTTLTRWPSLDEAKPGSGWYHLEFGSFVVAFKLDW